MERLGNIVEEVVRLSRIVEGLLLVSRLEAKGEAQMKMASINLGELVTSTARAKWNSSARTNGSPSDTKSTVASWWKATNFVLRQVVVNLIDNAIKYTPAGGGIILRGPRVRNTRRFWKLSTPGSGISSARSSADFQPLFPGPKRPRRDACTAAAWVLPLSSPSPKLTEAAFTSKAMKFGAVNSGSSYLCSNAKR